MKRIFEFFILVLLLPQFSSLYAENAADYFPLDIGNEWVYEDCSERDYYNECFAFSRTVDRLIEDPDFGFYYAIRHEKINFDFYTKQGIYFLSSMINDSRGVVDLQIASGELSNKIINATFQTGDLINRNFTLRHAIYIRFQAEVESGGVTEETYFYGTCSYDMHFSSEILNIESIQSNDVIYSAFPISLFLESGSLYNCTYEHDPTHWAYDPNAIYQNGNGLGGGIEHKSKIWLAKHIGPIAIQDYLYDAPYWVIKRTSLDADSDGVANIVDNCPNDVNSDQINTDDDSFGNICDTDDDNDGVLDVNDAFPTDSTETQDSDGDGVGDNSDAFPADPAETMDSDGDGYGNNMEVATGTDPLDASDYPRSKTILNILPLILDQ